MGISGDDTGKVFYWDMAQEPLDEESFEEDYGYPMSPEDKRSNLYVVAHSFEEFLNSLTTAG